MCESTSDTSMRVGEMMIHESDERIQELYEYFREEYEHEPKFFVKVPGRVNIIGEHIDYCGYPVLPMAIEQSIILAVSPSNDELLHLRNINKKYSSFKCDSKNFKIDIPEAGGPAWYSYFLCGVKGIFEHDGGKTGKCGMMVAVSGNVPPASGLSSSSALVSAATLATATLCDVNLCPQKLAEISARCERYIGTQGGGMDQAIAYLAKPGYAQFIHFYPELKAEPVRLPSGAVFVVANSLAEINKAATSDFNERVVECRLSCHILAKKMNFNNWKEINKFAILQKSLDYTLEELEQLAKKELTKDLYSRNDILNELQITDEQLANDFLTPNTRNMKSFKLQQRAFHVIQESIRVWRFRATCESDGCNNDKDFKTLSQLMSDSHTSLRTLYECSHPYLDKLVHISKQMGVGARLTGAGWGGCIVALCDSTESCKAYIRELKEKYYKDLPQAKGRNLDKVIFATCPHGGAEIFYLKINK